MAGAGVNLATTKDGGAYNKLQRPADYLLSAAPPLPALLTATNPTSQSSKRKRGRDTAPDGKRLRVDQKFGVSNGGGYVRESGMRAMLPGLDNEEEQLSDSSTNEALAYLRSVRSEASTIPPLLVAPTDTQDNTLDDGQFTDTDDVDNQGLIYEDGVWMAVDEVQEATFSDTDDVGYDEWNDYGADLDPQESYYDLLLQRYSSLRRRLSQAKTNDTDQTKRTSVEKPRKTRLPKSKPAWIQNMDTVHPEMNRVLSMSEQNVFLGLQYCALDLSKSDTISHAKCCWIWTLLALTGEVGTLDHELASKLRDLGLQATQLGERLRYNTSRHQNLREDDNLDTNKSEAEMDISDEEAGSSTNKMPTGDHAEIRKTSHTPSEMANEEHHEDSRNGSTSKSDDEKPMSNKETGRLDEKETETLEQARARLLTQLGDRLVQPGIPSSRAEAEWQRVQIQKQQGQEQQNQDMTQRNVVADGHIAHDVGGQGDSSTDSNWNTRTAIDMILTVVAECYGQRDLLKFRQTW